MGNYYDAVRMLRTVNEAIVKTWRCPTDGGWTNQPPKLLQPRHSGVWSTAQGVLWLLEYDPAHYPDQIAAGVNRLIALRHRPGSGAEVTDGGWGAQLEGPSDAVGTALALLALVRHVERTSDDIPKDYLEAIYGGRDWLLSALERDGGWGSTANRPSAAGMFCGCLALLEYSESRLPDDARVDRGLAKALGAIANSRKGGGWAQYIRDERADAIGTAYCTCTLLSGEYATNEQCLQMARTGAQWLLMNHRTQSGLWEVTVAQSPIEAAAWATMALLATGEIAEAEAAVTYLTGAGDPSLGWPSSPGPNAKPRFYSTYYAARALLQYRDAKRQARALPPSQVGNRIFVIRQSSDAKVKAAVTGEIERVVKQQRGLTTVLLEAATFEALSRCVEEEATRSGIDYAFVVLEDAHSSSGALDVAGKLTSEIGPDFVTILYEREKPYPQELSPVRLVHLKDAHWKGQVTENLRIARLVADA